MIKKILVAVATISIEVIASVIIANKSDMPFNDSAFFVGLISTLILYFISSEGGFTTDIVDVNIQGRTGMKMKRQDFIFKRGISFTVSLLFFIIMAIPVLIMYF